MSFSIFTYDIPQTLLQPWGDPCKQDMYYMEYLWPELVKKSPFFTSNDQEATFYLVPQYSTCHYHKCVFEKSKSTDQCKEDTAAYLTESKQHWNVSGGSDHLLIFTWDQASEVLGWNHPIRKRISSTIHLTTLGSQIPFENFNPHKDIVIPPFANFSRVLEIQKQNAIEAKLIETFQGIMKDFNVTRILDELLAASYNAISNFGGLPTRGIFAYFRGTILPDFRYSFGVRQYLKELGNLYPDLYWVREGHSPDYWHELLNSTFSLCPSGWSSWSPRLFDSIVAGAIPVIFADNIALPFEYNVDYREFSVKLRNDDVSQLHSVLQSISPAEILRKRRAIDKIVPSFVWNIPPRPNDAFHMTILELHRKRKHKGIGYASFQ
ncbi:hypothetical protein HDU97_007486 [Phlyctochytrium planicorne]|nr:hypothetical protein HDU97_007486 [Phlyctochytrium planicorne]